MAKKITMPALSPSMEEGTLVRWLKKEGDLIKKGEVIAEVETDKATMDLEAFDEGTLLKILLPKGEKVEVNMPIAWIGKHGEEIPKEEVESSERVKVSPLVRKIAREKGIDLTKIVGSGPGGRIIERDLEKAEAPTLERGDQRIELSNMRRTIARRLVESKNKIPHFYLEIEINAEPMQKARESLNANRQDSKITLNDLILRSCVDALKKVPRVNASFEGETILQHSAIHLSFAVAIEDGLMTPVIRDAQGKSLEALSEESKALTAKAKEGKLQPSEYEGGTFTVSNLGMYGIERFSAIINPPQAVILAVGAIQEKPIVREGKVEIGRRMTLTLSCDHRVVDGALGAIFLKELKMILEDSKF